MKYISTRGAAPVLDFDGVLLAGLARDGGLYLPEHWPQISAQEIRDLAGLPYAQVVARIARPFVGAGVAGRALEAACEEAYAGFTHSAVAPLRQLDSRTWLLELFHGPTLAFKDYALQLVGGLFEALLQARGARITVVGATSGDTGSAAIEACRGRKGIEIFILHPHGRITEVQRRQMTTVTEANVHNLAIEGTFDDCQDLLKAMFNDSAFRDELNLSAVNSINWARIMGQVAYYFAAAVALGAPDREVAFSVPTGNFGNVFAGYVAGKMGLPLSRLIVGTNRNDILTRCFESGRMASAEVQATLSPSMDIQVSSNFERLLFELSGRDGAAVAATMAGFRETGTFELGAERLRAARELFQGHRFDDAATLEEISRLYRETGVLIDPHSAIGLLAARTAGRELAVPVVALATAHPAKFPDAVEQASGVRPALPPFLSDLLERQERMILLPNDLASVQRQIRQSVKLRGAA